jgi:hypothetical protein
MREAGARVENAAITIPVVMLNRISARNETPNREGS